MCRLEKEKLGSYKNDLIILRKIKCKKWCAQIKINKKKKHIGYFDNEEDARNAYLEAKAKYHVINPHPHPQEI